MRSAGTLRDYLLLVCRDVLPPVHGAAGPAHLHAVCLLCGAQPEVQAQITGGEVAGAAAHLIALRAAAGRDPHLRPDAIPVALAAYQAQPQPVVAVPAIIAQQPRRPVVLGNKDVEEAVVIVVAVGSAPPHPGDA